MSGLNDPGPTWKIPKAAICEAALVFVRHASAASKKRILEKNLSLRSGFPDETQ